MRRARMFCGAGLAPASAVVLALVLVLAGCGSAQPESAPTVAPTEPAAPSTGAGAQPDFYMGFLDGTALPDGWRYESFGDAEIGVPGDWGYGVTGRQWCTHKQGDQPYVGRPGPLTALGCASGAKGTDPATRVATAGTFVWFDRISSRVGSSPTPVPSGSGGSGRSGGSGGSPAYPGSTQSTSGDRLTIRLGDVTVAIQAETKLREQIASTFHGMTEDSRGCPATHDISTDPALRPAGQPGGQKTLAKAATTEITVCKYAIHDRSLPPAQSSLISSSTISGARAAATARAIYAGAKGGGPDDPSSCTKEWRYGDEVIVLMIKAGTEPDLYHWWIAMRYSGCAAHGFDDGSTVHALTRASVAPILTGANEVRSFSGELAGLIPRPQSH